MGRRGTEAAHAQGSATLGRFKPRFSCGVDVAYFVAGLLAASVTTQPIYLPGAGLKRLPSMPIPLHIRRPCELRRSIPRRRISVIEP